MQNLILAHININSLRNKFDDISVLLCDNVVDILAINETKLDNSFPNVQFIIQGYTLFRRDRNANGGGVILYIRSDLPCRRLTNMESSHIEAIVAEIHIKKQKWVVIAAYNPPRNSDKTFTAFL